MTLYKYKLPSTPRFKINFRFKVYCKNPLRPLNKHTSATCYIIAYRLFNIAFIRIYILRILNYQYNTLMTKIVTSFRKHNTET
jgi:hypothetical protein